jgi:hypothetical protein
MDAALFEGIKWGGILGKEKEGDKGIG